ncbi:isoprenylcysteine carboxylmethyltransferase family protein [Zoogloea sp.]|uniref:methyltransferase family protein n=1 Tax=Zoogloea sp. TaxID=49181 RepID=UPI0025FBFD4F|nr:isoprenylcysteine carboxylmethyltransferase family protein [Zoogloea sp.]MCK6394687.1 isoprenylcysteine carboxylmethyltransferase family protein [Zoogloea sp.]
MNLPPWWQGRRGEGYVAVQAVLFGLLLFGPTGKAALPPWPAALGKVAPGYGLVLLVVGVLIAVCAAIGLGRNLTPLPHPRDDCQLVETGLYAWVRHPIYCGLILAALGWALFVQGWLTLAWAGLLLAFFDIKSRREEAWLMARFPGYAAYRRRVRKLIPYLY